MSRLFVIIYTDHDGDLAMQLDEALSQQAMLDAFVAKRPGRRVHLITAWGVNVGDFASLERVLDHPTIDTSNDYAKWPA